MTTPVLAATRRRAAWRSPAKVNLCLRVVGRRADGYHLLDSIFVPVDLCDRIEVEIEDVRAGGETSLEVRCEFPGVPQDERNLAARAARALLAACGLGARLRLVIEKTIPPGAGLGGGSGNAATVLRGLDAMLGLSSSAGLLRELALALGADVPFFLCGGAARVRGIGENVQPITGWPDLHLVVAIPPVEIATAWVFQRFAEGVGDASVEPGRGASPARRRGAAGGSADGERPRTGGDAVVPDRGRAQVLAARGGRRRRRDVGERVSGGGAGVVGGRGGAHRLDTQARATGGPCPRGDALSAAGG